MTLDVNQPTDQVLVSELPSFIREDRVEIGSIAGAGNVGVTNLTVAAGVSQLTVGSELGNYGLETVVIDSVAAISLAYILGGTEGQIKVFVFQDSRISLVDGPKSGGQFYLNHLPVLSNYSPQQDSVIALVNIGGDGASEHGYWKELYRVNSVK